MLQVIQASPPCQDKSLTQILATICNALLTLREQLAPDTSLRLMRHLMENRSLGQFVVGSLLKRDFFMGKSWETVEKYWNLFVNAGL